MTVALISSYKANRSDEHHYEGAYFGIGSDLGRYPKRPSERYPQDLVDDLISEIRTDLDAFSEAEAAILQNHGYAACDAAVRSWSLELADRDAPPPASPCPDWVSADAAERELRDRGSHKRRLPFGRFR